MQVGTTTNAMLLNEETVRKVIESGIDILAFSLAGTGESNDLIRKGTSLKKVLKAIGTLNREKERQGKTTPEIHVAYMLFRSGMGELDALPGLLEGLGVSQVVVSTLDFVPTEELRKEAVIPVTQEEYEEVRSVLDHLVEAGREKGLSVHYHLVSPDKRRGVCTENIQKALCISADGAVTPCVYTNLRVSGTYYQSAGQESELREDGLREHQGEGCEGYLEGEILQCLSKLLLQRRTRSDLSEVPKDLVKQKSRG